MDSNKKTLYLYSTTACHLCEIAVQLIHPILEYYNLHLEEVDIVGSEDLMNKYGIRIPVIRIAGQEEELGWPFDHAMLEDYLRQVIKLNKS